MNLKCNCCGRLLTEKIYESGAYRSLTSLCTAYDGKTEVYFCRGCGHVQSVEITNIDQYYDSDYDILVESEEEDQVYEVVNGATKYRTEHQVNTLLEKVGLPSDIRILDYGCAKSSTMRALLNRSPSVKICLFDVSDRYISFWNKFLSEDCWATYVIPSAWDGQFDVVTTFFSMEHMARPQDALSQIFRVLKAGGTVYGIVPNVFTNTADMIVVDHVNHFTSHSLDYLLRSNGFKVTEIDDRSHRGALIFKAEKVTNRTNEAPEQEGIQRAFDEALTVARFWKDIRLRVKDFELSISDTEQFAVYGAGFYGAFISSCLQHPERIACVIDQNPFLQGRKVNGVTVISPTDMPEFIKVVLIGLNPAYAKCLIGEVAEFRLRQLTYFFL